MRTLLPAIVVIAALCVIVMVAFSPPASIAQSDVQQSSHVAIIDLGSIAKKLGRTETITADVNAKQTDLNNQLNTAQQQVNAQIKAKQDEFGATPTADQIRQLQQLRSQLGSKLLQARQQAKQMLAQHQAQVLNKFRDEVKPHAQAVAKEQGYRIVLVKNDQLVFTHTASVDITEAVIAKMAK